MSQLLSFGECIYTSWRVCFWLRYQELYEERDVKEVKYEQH